MDPEEILQMVNRLGLFNTIDDEMKRVLINGIITSFQSIFEERDQDRQLNKEVLQELKKHTRRLDTMIELLARPDNIGGQRSSERATESNKTHSVPVVPTS